jgi:hypothetical protein
MDSNKIYNCFLELAEKYDMDKYQVLKLALYTLSINNRGNFDVYPWLVTEKTQIASALYRKIQKELYDKYKDEDKNYPGKWFESFVTWKGEIVFPRIILIKTRIYHILDDNNNLKDCWSSEREVTAFIYLCEYTHNLFKEYYKRKRASLTLYTWDNIKPIGTTICGFSRTAEGYLNLMRLLERGEQRKELTETDLGDLVGLARTFKSCTYPNKRSREELIESILNKINSDDCKINKKFNMFVSGGGKPPRMNL